MSPTTKKARSKKTQQPVSTSAISQPAVQDSASSVISAFSPDASLFAVVSLSVDKHRLRVYNTASAHSVLQHVLDFARVCSLLWSPAAFNAPASLLHDSQPTKKKRKKRASIPSSDSAPALHASLLALGLSDGSISVFSPSHGKIVHTLSHPTSTSPILAISYFASQNTSTLWSSGADGVVRLWDLQRNELLRSWKSDDPTPYTAIMCRPVSSDDQPSVDVLLAHHQITLISDHSEGVEMKPKTLASYTGHASSVKSLRWETSTAPSSRFVSMAENDRCLYLWKVDASSNAAGKPIASIPLDSDAREFTLSDKLHPSNQKPALATLSTSGKVSIFSLPEQSQEKVSTLSPEFTLTASGKDVASNTRIVSILLAPEEPGSIRVARLVRGIRPVFDVVPYLDDAGNVKQNIILDEVQEDALSELQAGPTQNRYSESSSLAAGSGLAIGHSEEADGIQEVEGELEVDMAEMSLGQRLAVISSTDPPRISDSDDELATDKAKTPRKKARQELNAAPANSLTRTLIQALHSNDARLLETCLAHSDATLIQNTVRVLPPQLAIPLINACVERLSRGARAGNMKGGGGGASAQRGMSLITWIKAVLIIHAGHLMTIPDLVARLAGFHATLTSRSSLFTSLVSLSGRLDMVLSQVEMRTSVAPTTLAPRQKKPSTSQGKQVKHYVEGESESSEGEDMQVDDVDVESGDEEGSIEDVELGIDNDDDDDENEDDEDEDSNEGSLNGFIDDEAEEYSGEEEEDSE